MRIPSIQIVTQPARLGIESTPSKVNIEQPRATFELTTKAPYMQIESPRGDLDIDQTRAWDALAVGHHLEVMRTIFSEVKNIVLSTIGRIATEGDQLAAIHVKTNAIADIAENRRVDRFELNFAGPAGPDNVDIFYTERKVEFQPMLGEVNLRAEQNSPRMEYVSGKIDIYVAQYHKIEIIPPQINLQV